MRNKIVFGIFASAYTYSLDVISPKTCLDHELSDSCQSECELSYVGCTMICYDTKCLTECATEFHDCANGCPCGCQCPDGCIDCPNPICIDYIVPGPSILVMNHWKRHSTNPRKPPLLIGYDGVEQEELKLSVEDEVEVAVGCSATLNGEHFILGGDFPQINKVNRNDCNVENIGTLPFNSKKIACTVIEKDNESRIMMCFPDGDGDKCWSWNGIVGSSFLTHKNSNNDHEGVPAIGFHKNAVIAVSGINTNTVEWYNIPNNQWLIDEEPFPFCEAFHNFALVMTPKSAFLFGGIDGRDCVGSQHDYGTGIVVKYSLYTADWSFFDVLQIPREGHRVIGQVINHNFFRFYVIGGYSGVATEIWTLNSDDEVIAKKTGDILGNYAWFPESFFVEPDFCT